MRTPPLLKYRRLLARLFQLRALGPLAEEMEETIAEALNDCRSEMNLAEEQQIEGLIAELRGIRAKSDLGLKDTVPSTTTLPREAA